MAGQGLHLRTRGSVGEGRRRGEERAKEKSQGAAGRVRLCLLRDESIGGDVIAREAREKRGRFMAASVRKIFNWMAEADLGAGVYTNSIPIYINALGNIYAGLEIQLYMCQKGEVCV